MKSPFARILVFALLCVAFGSVFPLLAPLVVQLFKIHLHLSGIAFELYLLACVLGALFVMLRFVDRCSVTALGLTQRDIVRDSVSGFLIGAGIVCLSIGAQYIAGWYRITGRNPGFSPLDVFVLPLIIGLVEEIAFRGYIFANLERRYGSGVALAVSSVLFGLVHLANVSSGTLAETMLYIVDICFVGLLLGIAFLVTRSLWLAIGLHWGYDALVYCLDNREGIALFQTKATHETASVSIEIFLTTIAGLFLLRLALRRGNWLGSAKINSTTSAA